MILPNGFIFHSVHNFQRVRQSRRQIKLVWKGECSIPEVWVRRRTTGKVRRRQAQGLVVSRYKRGGMNSGGDGYPLTSRLCLPSSHGNLVFLRLKSAVLPPANL